MPALPTQWSVLALLTLGSTLSYAELPPKYQEEMRRGDEFRQVQKWSIAQEAYAAAYDVAAQTNGERKAQADAAFKCGLSFRAAAAAINAPEIKDAIRAFCVEQAADEKTPDETDEQFVYKTRKKALGPFKKRLWEMPKEAKDGIIGELEAKFEFLMQKLGVFDTVDIVNEHVRTSNQGLPEYAAASDELTAQATVDPNEGE